MAHWLLGTPAGSVVMIFLLVILGAASYFLPSLLAWARQAVSLRWIFLVNLLLAWTVIGWIVVLLWALLAKPKRWELDEWPEH